MDLGRTALAARDVLGGTRLRVPADTGDHLTTCTDLNGELWYGENGSGRAARLARSTTTPARRGPDIPFSGHAGVVLAAFGDLWNLDSTTGQLSRLGTGPLLISARPERESREPSFTIAAAVLAALIGLGVSLLIGSTSVGAWATPAASPVLAVIALPDKVTPRSQRQSAEGAVWTLTTDPSRGYPGPDRPSDEHGHPNDHLSQRHADRQQPLPGRDGGRVRLLVDRGGDIP